MRSVQNYIHETSDVLLDGLEHSGRLLLETSHELLKERRVLNNSLSNALELRIVHKSREVLINFHARALFVIVFFVKVVTHIHMLLLFGLRGHCL